ncbi:MAG: hypothetical protein HYS40_03970 [Gemmatimonadetes bacterium]|nr:hypothetical protein [Gemmatimonadota bacterium]
MASAQGPGVPRDRASWTRGVIHYGKWVTAGATVGLTVLGANEHRRSARAWDRLLAICQANSADCMTGSDGRYVNATAEYHYQLALYYDRRANRRLLGGQLSLLATAAMFIADLRHEKNGPENIPFAPLEVTASPAGDGARVGLRFTF